MDQAFGMAAASPHVATGLRPVAHFLVLIESGAGAVARLCLDSREPVAEFDAATEELASMTEGLVPQRGAAGPEWDRALSGFGADARASAAVYRLAL